MSARRSCRLRSQRAQCSKPKVRSTTRCHRPSRSRDSRPCRAIRSGNAPMVQPSRMGSRSIRLIGMQLTWASSSTACSSFHFWDGRYSGIRNASRVLARLRSERLAKAHAHPPADGVCLRVCRDRQAAAEFARQVLPWHSGLED